MQSELINQQFDKVGYGLACSIASLFFCLSASTRFKMSRSFRNFTHFITWFSMMVLYDVELSKSSPVAFPIVAAGPLGLPMIMNGKQMGVNVA